MSIPQILSDRVMLKARLISAQRNASGKCRKRYLRPERAS